MSLYQSNRSRLVRTWDMVLHVCFALLCARFLVAAVRENPSAISPTLLLAVGSAALGWWRIGSALVAFAAAVPWLNGLEQTALLPGASLAPLTFCGIFLGWGLRQMARLLDMKPDDQACPPLAGTTDSTPRPSPGSGSVPFAPCTSPPAIGRQAFSLLHYSGAINVLITVVLASLLWQMARHPDQAALWAAFSQRPALGFGDPLYFLTSAFVWLQGLFFLKLLLAEDSVTLRQPDATPTNGPLSGWLRLLFLSYSLSLLAFAALQRQWHLPDKYYGFAYTSPFEDIHSFGSIAVACLTFLLTAWRFKPLSRTIGYGLCIAALLTLVILSWSRATWLAGFAATALIIFFRVSWRWRIGLVLAGVGLLVAANQAAKTPAWQNHLYLSRLSNLVRFESPMQKDPSRMNLYHKALGMIQEQPLTGHGIGSFYLKSVQYAQDGDLYAAVPDFAHNFLLQFAAELGVPAALLLAALIGFTLIRGYRLSRQAIQMPGSDLTVLGVTMALTAYLITQMTANALNIYPSNQFFFWFLVAAISQLSLKNETSPAPTANGGK